MAKLEIISLGFEMALSVSISILWLAAAVDIISMEAGEESNLEFWINDVLETFCGIEVGWPEDDFEREPIDEAEWDG